MEGNDHDNRPRSDRQYREGLMTGLLIALANQVGQGWSTAIIIVITISTSWWDPDLEQQCWRKR